MPDKPELYLPPVLTEVNYYLANGHNISEFYIFPYFAHRKTRTGFPTTTVSASTSFVTTEPAPTMLLSPIITCPRTNALLAIKTLFPILGIFESSF